MRTIAFVIAALLAGLVYFSFRAGAQPEVPPSTKEFMREKLAHSQKILEALTMEDYSMLTQRSQKLSALTRQANWRVFQNPDYDQFSAAFQSQVDALTKAAKEKNIDAGTLAYVRMTISCVDCHKYVRGKLVGAVQTPQGFARY